MAENDYGRVLKLGPKADSAAAIRVLKNLYQQERQADKLRADMLRHRERAYAANQRDIRQLAQLAVQTHLGNMIVLLLVIGTAVFSTRRSIVKPVNCLANAASEVTEGDFEQAIVVTSNKLRDFGSTAMPSPTSMLLEVDIQGLPAIDAVFRRYLEW